MASDHQKNGNILLSSRPLPALVPESHYIHVCVFCVLITCGPGLTGMFYRVSLYLIVCHLSSYWVTSCHTMTGRASHLCHTTLGLIWLICVRLSSVGLWRDWRSVSSNINHPVLMHSLTWEWQGLVLSTENLPRHHCWLFQPPFEDSLARRAIRCWLSFYNWVIIFLLLSFLDFPAGPSVYFKLTVFVLTEDGSVRIFSLSLSLHSSILPKKVEKDLDKLQIFPISFSICTVDR